MTGSAARADNDIYRRLGHAWWDDEVGAFATIRYFVHPVRLRYLSGVLAGERARGAVLRTALDVGCGGGLMAEDLARAGLCVVGIDPAPETIAAARDHAASSGLEVEYRTARGEELPFQDGSFDVVVCCDVLEHVDDLGRVVAEAARVLRPGGVFFYDTINRTLASRFAVIKVMQEWRSTAFAPPGAHSWERFVRPAELAQLLARQGLHNRELRGIGPRRRGLGTLLELRRCAKGEISYRELGRRLDFAESNDLAVSYMGFAVRS